MFCMNHLNKNFQLKKNSELYQILFKILTHNIFQSKVWSFQQNLSWKPDCM